jgi:hypothetical protein
VYGKETDKIIKEHEINIEMLPDWKSLELMLSDNGLPEIVEEQEVEKANSPSIGFSKSTYRKHQSHGHSVIDVGSSSTSLPIVAGAGKTKHLPARIDDFSTGQLLEISSEETREQGTRLCMAATEAASVVSCINKNRFMQYEEIEHWKKWSKNV